MNLYESASYQKEIAKLAQEEIPYHELKNKSVLITGASGLIGSYLVDTLMYLNDHNNMNCFIYAVGTRDNYRFLNYENHQLFKYIKHDINNKIDLDINVDYIIHLASNTHPYLYAKEPVKTITTNVIGTNNLLDFAKTKKITRFLFASTVEVYGNNRGDVKLFDEDYCGYINSNVLRAGYPESKRCAEALCQAYIEEHNIDIVIARFPRVYGPTVLSNDSKAINQFIFKALKNEDIVLKSEGIQEFSYSYVYDVVYGLLIALLKGIVGNAYNVSYPESDIKLKDIANLIAKKANKKVIFELPNEVEKKGFSLAINARMDNTKIKALGFNPRYNMEDGIESTINILKEANNG